MQFSLLDPSIASDKVRAGLNQVSEKVLLDSSLWGGTHLGPDYGAGINNIKYWKVDLKQRSVEDYCKQEQTKASYVPLL